MSKITKARNIALKEMRDSNLPGITILKDKSLVNPTKELLSSNLSLYNLKHNTSRRHLLFN